MIWAVLATGESMNQESADYVKGKCSVVVISDAYKLAPWADVLVSNDSAWWHQYPEALNFAGRKFCAARCEGTEKIQGDYNYPPSCNSGLMGMRLAVQLGATKIILLGFDMKGTHYFGQHPLPLKNTTPKRFKQHLLQFNRWKFPDCQVINCSIDSALNRFPKANLRDVL